jgi:DNA polymerase I-like protein with 3'-5' exonuclease and polymerase domains
MSKSDNIAVATTLLDDFTSIKVKELIELRPWMKTKRFILLTKQTEIEEYIDKCVQKGLCVYDLETNSLNTRKDADNGCHAKIVGICLSHDPDEGIYIPVAHEHAEEFNVSLNFMIRQTKKLAANCVLIFHNFKYDGQILLTHGVEFTNEDMYEDTYLMAAIEDASRKTKNLKYLSGALLDRPQLEIDDLGIQGTKKGVVAFYLVPPQKAVYYGGGDGMNTMALYLYLKGKLNAIDPTGKEGPWAIYKVEKRCLFVTMEMERNLVKIDKQYLIKINAEVEIMMSKLIKEIFSIVGHEFDINSTQQLGSILFNELKLPYPPKAEKTKTGHYQTNSEILEMISTKNPIINLILTYRGYVKIQSTYLYNWLTNADENDEVKFQLNQVQADTGRFSGSGGQGLEIDGYCGVNCQNIPTYDKSNPYAVNLRRAMIAHFGFKMVSIDYSGEELRIATNFSKEPKWVQEFLHGTGDLHTITGKIITGKTEITKKERSLGKTVNFLTMYGGGAGGFAAQAKIPFETAKKMILNFFKEYVGLNSWIKREWAASRKRGYSKTAFGRRRPLEEFYNSPDKGIQSKGDRCAINSAIQGCLTKEERVLTNKGYIPIGELYILPIELLRKLKIWTGTSWETFDVINRGKAQLAQLELSNGMVLNCDTRHEVLVVGKEGYEFRHFSDLNEDTEICVSIPTIKQFGEYPADYTYESQVHNGKSFCIKTKEQWDFIGYLMGYIIGDGGIRTDSRQSLTLCLGAEKIKKYLPTIEESLKDLGLCLSNMRKTNSAKGESYQVQINSKGLVDLFIKLGYIPADARGKRIPEVIYKAPVAMRKAFLQGYFDTDGCKKRKNRYGYHTPNIALLRDVQLIGWTLGLSSIVRSVTNGNFKLEWQDLKKVEDLLDLPPTIWKLRNTINKMILPNFLREVIRSNLHSVYDRKNANDCAYFCKLNTGKVVTLPGMISLMEKYTCELPSEIYYHYKLKRKTVIDKIEDTYTLAVHSDLHRFDSVGIISKNTGADVIKIALWRVYKWIYDNNLQDDVKILLPVHDEVLYEVREEKMDMIVPELCRLMKIRDITDKLKWVVPLEVDAEYGDSFHVDHDYWKEMEAKMADVSSPVSVLQSSELPSECLPEKPLKPEEPVKPDITVPTLENDLINNGEKKEIDSEINKTSSITGSTTNEAHSYYQNSVVGERDIGKEVPKILGRVPEKIDTSFCKDIQIEKNIDKDGSFNYTIDINIISAQKIKFILEVLRSGNNLFVGPRNKLCLMNKDGEILYKSTEEFSVDSFLALCLMLSV